jgi:2-oxoisovalerate dehydrogenase E2 component (dihydrolipoyl transacylase)
VPDIGEGIAEVELVAWHVKPATWSEDQVLADVMTDKATVEIRRRCTARCWPWAAPGQVMAGAELVRWRWKAPAT